MIKAVPVLAFVSGLLLSAWTPAQACGDKLLLLGRGVRFLSDTQTQPASILLYMNRTSPGYGALSDPKLQSALREDGHKLYAVSERKELDEALVSGKYDIVLTDVADATELENSLRTATSKPVLVPVVYKGTTGDAKRAKSLFGFVLKTPSRTGYYCSVVNSAMEAKLKRDRSKNPKPGKTG